MGKLKTNYPAIAGANIAVCAETKKTKKLRLKALKQRRIDFVAITENMDINYTSRAETVGNITLEIMRLEREINK